MIHYDITLSNDIVSDIHCDITMGNAIVMGIYHDVTMDIDVAKILIYLYL